MTECCVLGYRRKSFDIYIAHAREGLDNAIAREVSLQLRKRGHSVALEVDGALHGAWQVTARNLIAGCKCVVLVLTADATKRLERSKSAGHLRAELKMARLLGKPIIPVRQPFAPAGEGAGAPPVWKASDDSEYDDSDDGNDPWNWKREIARGNEVHGPTINDIVDVLLRRELPDLVPARVRTLRIRLWQASLMGCLILVGGLIGWRLSGIQHRVSEAGNIASSSRRGSAVSSASASFVCQWVSGGGIEMERAGATRGTTQLLKRGDIARWKCKLPMSGQYSVRWRCSNDQPRSHAPDRLAITVDSTEVGSQGIPSTGEHGAGWNNFAEACVRVVGPLSAAEHEVAITVSECDGFGVEIDKASVEFVAEKTQP